MSSSRIDEQVREYYAGRTLSPERLEALQRKISDHRGNGVGYEQVRARLRIRPFLTVAGTAAAAIVLTLAGVFLFERDGRSLFGAIEQEVVAV